MKRSSSDLEILQEIMDLEGRWVLDVGCGSGGLARALSEKGAVVVGLEAPALLSELVAVNGDQGCCFAVCGGQRLCVRAASIDLVLFMASFHHVPVPAMVQALSEARAVVGDQGRIVVVEPVAEPGSYYELIRLAEDERELHLAAYRALQQAGSVGLCLGKEWLVYFERRFEDFVGLIESYVDSPNEQRRILGEARTVAKQLATAVQHEIDDHIFKSVCRVSCFVPKA